LSVVGSGRWVSAPAAGLLADDPQRLRPSERGQLFLNDLLQHFLP
ncbi:YggW family oxidoreductase, partial [Pseudomonas aeruginosa]|nr:YggW family oxidoreductase [Pseudomonas aeruginosa]